MQRYQRLAAATLFSLCVSVLTACTTTTTVDPTPNEDTEEQDVVDTNTNSDDEDESEDQDVTDTNTDSNDEDEPEDQGVVDANDNSADDTVQAAATARYRVTFNADWTADSHPQDYPPSAHFSPLVGATHTSSARLWSMGEESSPGIELMAETGGTSTLVDEIKLGIEEGELEFLLQGSGGSAVATITLEFEITQQHPAVTLVTMIAPSPDWFVGVSALELFVDGDWIDSVQIDLVPYDSGTDSGESFQSSNEDTQPPEPITAIENAPLVTDQVVPLGTFEFVRIE